MICKIKKFPPQFILKIGIYSLLKSKFKSFSSYLAFFCKNLSQTYGATIKISKKNRKFAGNFFRKYSSIALHRWTTIKYCT